ncbi:DsbA family protein [Thermodesulfobacteriota bacterium]
MKSDTEERVLEKYPRDVKLVFKNYPLRNHKFVRPAAIAALAAGKQGRFWEFHDLLFKNYSRLTAQKINEIARQLDLNMVQFEKDQKDSRIQDQVARDLSDGAKVSVRGTPTVFINGRLLRNRDLTGFQRLIEKVMEKQP